MQFGLFLPNFNCFGDPHVVTELARVGEAAGWQGIFLWDHVNRKAELGPVVDPWIAMAAIAARTAKIRMGALITPLPRRRPWKVARECLSLDHLSDGRLIFGAGIGSGRGFEWEDLGEVTDARIRAEMLDEGLAIMTGLWSGQPYSHVGQHYTVDNVQFLPRPVQQPRIPVWVGGNWPNKGPLRRAARWDGSFVIFPSDTDSENLVGFREMVSFIHEERGRQGDYDFVYRGAPDASLATMAAFAQAGATWWLVDMAPFRFGAEWESEWPLATMRDFVLAGPPQLPST